MSRDGSRNRNRFERNPEWDALGGWLEVAATGDPNDELIGQVVDDRSVLETTLEEADRFDAVLVGEPYDGAVIGRRGAGEGPVAIRRSLARTKTHHFDRGPLPSVADLGDVASLLENAGFLDGGGSTESVSSVQERVREATRAVHDLEVLPIFVGGDNSLTYPNVAPLLERGSVGVINLDAHLDVREVRDGPTSGTPYRQLLEDGLESYACVGARHFETSTAYHEYARECGAEIVTAEEVGDDPVGAADLALEAMGDVDFVYVSVDCDVLDAGVAPGVSAPTPGGITTRELFRTVRLLASDDRLAGFEVVECAPPLDETGRTADGAARAIAHALAGWSA